MMNNRLRGEAIITGIVIASLLLFGLSIRLFLVPKPGYEFDVGVNKGWARSAAELGVAKSYSEQVGGNMLPNYAPMSLLIFAAVGHVQLWTAADPMPSQVLIKLPAILADIFTALMIALLAWKFRGRRAAWIIAGVYALHPAIMYDSAVWGQTDAIFTLFAVAAVGAMALGLAEAAAALAVVCVLTKMQGIFLLPLLAFVFIGKPWRTMVKSALCGLATGAIILAPFFRDGALAKIRDVYIDSVGFYPNLSTGAYNFWWMLFGDSAWGKQDSDLFFHLMSYRTLSVLLFGLAYAIILFLLRKPLLRAALPRDRFDGLFLAATLAAQAFFLFSAEMHERYLFPYLALGMPTILMGAAPLTLYICGSLFFWFNLLAILGFSFIDKALYNEFPTLDVAVACGQMTVFILLLIWAGQWARTVKLQQKHGRFTGWIRAALLGMLPSRLRVRTR